MRCKTERPLERTNEMRFAAPYDIAQIRDQYPITNVRIDVLTDTTRLPGVQAFAVCAPVTGCRAIDFGAQQRGGPDDGGPRRAAVPVKLLFCNIQQHQHAADQSAHLRRANDSAPFAVNAPVTAHFVILVHGRCAARGGFSDEGNRSTLSAWEPSVSQKA